MHIIFDVLHLYYLPQYLPVYHHLVNTGAGKATFVFYRGIHDDIINGIIAKENLTHIWVDNEQQATEFYLKEQIMMVINEYIMSIQLL
mgnify:CR=1 FL=1